MFYNMNVELCTICLHVTDMFQIQLYIHEAENNHESLIIVPHDLWAGITDCHITKATNAQHCISLGILMREELSNEIYSTL